MSKKLLMIFSFLLIAASVSAQKEIKLLKKESKENRVNSNKPGNEKVEIVELEGDDYFSLYKKKEYSLEISNGPFKNLSYQVSTFSLKMSNGTEFSFPAGENFLQASDDYLLTESYDFDTYIKEFHIYKIVDDILHKINSLSVDDIEVGAKIFNNILIVSNNSEGFGNEIIIYEINSVKLLKRYSPFPASGFSIDVVASGISEIFIFFTSYSNPANHKIILVNSNSGAILKEKAITSDNFYASTAKVFNNNFLLYGGGKIFCFDKSLQTVWEVNAVLPHHQFESGGDNYLYLVTDKKIKCLGLDSGELVWDFLFQKGEKNESKAKGHAKRIISFKTDLKDSSVVVLTGTTKKGHFSAKEIVHDPELYILDKKGSVQAVKILGAEKKDMSLVKKDGKILLTENEEVYEVVY